MKKSTYIILGVVLVAAGVLASLQVLGIVDVSIYFKGWWTLFIIIPSILAMVNTRDKTIPGICLAVGILLLLSARDIISWRTLPMLLLPVIIVIVGIRLIAGGVMDGRSGADNGVAPPKDSIWATFSNRRITYAGRQFDGIDVNAIFGSVQMDLTGAIMRDKTEIKIYAVFGSVEILMPDYAALDVKVVPLIAHISDKRPNKNKDVPAGTLVRGTAMFGGVTIR